MGGSTLLARNGEDVAHIFGKRIGRNARRGSDGKPGQLAALVYGKSAARIFHARLAAARLGFAWGGGHALSLFAFGLPIVLYRAYLPDGVQRGAEATVGLVIVALAARLLVRWRRGALHSHARARGPWQAGAIGIVHGMGGSAGVGVLLLAAIRSQPLAVGALALFAVCTALSMGILSSGFGLTLERPPVRRALTKLVPVLATASLVFGAVYTAGSV